VGAVFTQNGISSSFIRISTLSFFSLLKLQLADVQLDLSASPTVRFRTKVLF